MDKTELSIIIVSYNVRDLLGACIRSIRKQVNSSYEIIVFDNDSTDGTQKLPELEGKDVHFIPSTKNLGFAAGNNRALEYAKGEYIFFLNPDTELIDDSTDRMLEFLKKHPETGLLAPKLEYGNRKLQRSIRPYYSFLGSLIDNRFMALWLSRVPFLGRVFPFVSNHYKTQEIDWAKGAAILVRKETLNMTGPFDEDYWIYGEEIDLCYRIRKAGWRNVFLADATVIHYEGQSTRQRSSEMFLRNYLGTYLFLFKHFSFPKLWFYHARVGVFAHIWLLLFMIKGSPNSALYRELITWHKSVGRKLVSEKRSFEPLYRSIGTIHRLKISPSVNAA